MDFVSNIWSKTGLKKEDSTSDSSAVDPQSNQVTDQVDGDGNTTTTTTTTTAAAEPEGKDGMCLCVCAFLHQIVFRAFFPCMRLVEKKLIFPHLLPVSLFTNQSEASLVLETRSTERGKRGMRVYEIQNHKLL